MAADDSIKALVRLSKLMQRSRHTIETSRALLRAPVNVTAEIYAAAARAAASRLYYRAVRLIPTQKNFVQSEVLINSVLISLFPCQTQRERSHSHL
jgi:hypothetical protein